MVELKTMIVAVFLFLPLLFFDVIFLIKIISDIQSARGGAPYVPIPIEVARHALKLAQVSKDDVFYDLGCGDGKVLKMATKEFSVHKAIGYEIGWWPIIKFKVKSEKLNKIEIHHKNLLKADLREATVVFLYLSAKLSEKLGPKLANELSLNARIISCRYPLLNIDADINDFKIVKSGKVKGIKIWAYEKQNNKYVRDDGVTQITSRIKKIASQIPGESKKFIKNTFYWLEKNGFYKLVPEQNERKLLDAEHLQRTADEILASGYTIACGEQAIIFMVLCRARNIPVKYVEAVGFDFLQAKDDSHIHSHAFIEAYLGDKWILVDPSRRKESRCTESQ